MYNPYEYKDFIARIYSLMKNNEVENMRTKNPTAYNNLLFHIKKHPEYYSPRGIENPEQLVKKLFGTDTSKLPPLEQVCVSKFDATVQNLLEEVATCLQKNPNVEAFSLEHSGTYQRIARATREFKTEFKQIGVETPSDFLTKVAKLNIKRKGSNLTQEDYEKIIAEVQELSKRTYGFKLVSFLKRAPKLYNRVSSLIHGPNHPFGEDVKSIEDFLKKYCNVEPEKKSEPKIDTAKQTFNIKMSQDPRNLFTHVVEYCIESGKNPQQALEALGLVLPDRFVDKIIEQYEAATSK